MQNPKISFEYTLDDLRALRKNYLATNTASKIKIWANLIILFGLFAFIGIQSYLEKRPEIFIIVLILTLVILATMFLIKLFSNLIKMKLYFLSGDQKIIFGQHEMEFSEQGFKGKAPLSEYAVEWEKLHHYNENEKYIFIYITSSAAYIIPKFKIKAEEEMKAITQLIHTKLSRQPAKMK